MISGPSEEGNKRLEFLIRKETIQRGREAG